MGKEITVFDLKVHLDSRFDKLEHGIRFIGKKILAPAFTEDDDGDEEEDEY